MISNEDRKILEGQPESIPTDPVTQYSQIVTDVSGILGMPLVDVEFIEPPTSLDSQQTLIWKGWHVTDVYTDERVRMEGRIDYSEKDTIGEIGNALARSVALAVCFRTHPKGQQVQEYMKLCTLYQGDLVSVSIQWLASVFVRKYLEENGGVMPTGSNIMRKVAGVVNEEGMKFAPLIRSLKFEYDMRKNGKSQ